MIKTILERMAKSNTQYQNISSISVSHIYNLRQKPAYQRITKRFKKTKPSGPGIGLRQKPRPQGHPGFIRVDSLPQDDRQKNKGAYPINTINE